MLRAPAAVLATQVAEIAVVGLGVRDVPRPHVVQRRLRRFGEVRHESVDEESDEEETHEAADTIGSGV